MKLLLALIGVVLAVVGNVPYLRRIGTGVEPHPYTWALGSLVTTITFGGILLKGGGVGALPVAASLFFTLAIFAYSLRWGKKHITKGDTALLLLALAGLIPWYLTSDPTLSVVIAVAIDVLSFVPTMRKVWKYPSTEAPILYGTNVARHALVLAALESYNLVTTLHSVAMLIVNMLMVLLIALRARRGGTM